MHCDDVLRGHMCTFLALATASALAGEPEKPAPEPEPELSGGFRLEKDTYCVGEPIFAVLEVVNQGDSSLSFWQGGIESGRSCVRQSRFSVTVEDGNGERLQPPPTGVGSGRSGRVTLAPGGSYLQYLWLSGWTRLLPPGKYTARAVRFLNPGSDPALEGPAVRGSMTFTVEPYDCEKMKAAILGLHQDVLRRTRGTRHLKPVHWALVHVAKTFDMSVGALHYGVLRHDKRLAQKMIAQLPKAWDDRYYLEPQLTWNRNWLTADAPEEFTLTFSVRNNSPRLLSTGIPESRLYVDGKEIGAWKEMLARVAEEESLDRLESGEAVEFTLRFNAYVKVERTNQFTWRINGRVLRSEYICSR